MDSVTDENIKKIMAERDRKNLELQTLIGTTETQLWLNELAVLRTEYVKQMQAQTQTTTSTNALASEPKKIKVSKKPTKSA